MTEQENLAQFEDISLDESQADEIIGGRLSPGQYEHEMNVLKREGYIEAACNVDGALMYNPRTKRKVLVKY